VDVVVNDRVVPDRDIVAVSERDALEEPAVVATLGEEMLCEHLSEPEREGDVVRDRQAVELPPEPLDVL